MGGRTGRNFTSKRSGAGRALFQRCVDNADRNGRAWYLDTIAPRLVAYCRDSGSSDAFPSRGPSRPSFAGAPGPSQSSPLSRSPWETRWAPGTGGLGRYRHPVSPKPIGGESAGGASQEHGHGVGGVAIKRSPASVVAHSCPRIGVAGCFLDIPQRNAGVEGSGGVAVDPSAHFVRDSWDMERVA